MGILKCRTTATSFFIWKKKAKVELTSAYDGQAKLVKMIQVAEVIKRQRIQAKNYFIHCIRLFNAEKISKAVKQRALQTRAREWAGRKLSNQLSDRASRAKMLLWTFKTIRLRKSFSKILGHLLQWKLFTADCREAELQARSRKQDLKKISFRRKWQH